MTRTEARKLEENIEKIITCLIDQEKDRVEISLTLGNKLAVSTTDARYIFWRDIFECESINTKNNYKEFNQLQREIEDIEHYFKTNKEEINQLLWSYDNIRELED